MDADSRICLSDLVPALRWSRPQQVAEMLADPRLPGGWWASVALGRAMAVTGVDWLCERLARLAVERWDHIPLTDLLPALQVHSADPAMSGWPEPARSQVDGLGGWQRLRRLTPSDLRGPATPAAAGVLLATVFREVFGRLRPAASAAAPDSTTPASPTATPAGVTAPATRAAGSTLAGQSPSPQPATAPPSAAQPSTAPASPAQPSTAPASPAQPSTAQPAAAAPASPRPASAPASPAPGEPRPATPAAPAVPNLSDHPMVAVIEGLFRDWDPLARAVAAHRLFAAEPISLRTLAHNLQVQRDVLSQAQRAAEERVLTWLRSPDSAPLTGHLFGLSEWLGAAATQQQLIAADPSHPVEVPSLGVPLWRVLVTLMPDRRLQDGWLVVGDLAGLREKTRRLLANRPAGADVVELLGQIGVRSHSAKAWLDAMPETQTGETQSGPLPVVRQPATGDGPAPTADALPRRTPGANGHHQHRGGIPVPSQANNGPDAATALAALTALTGNAPRPHLVPGPRPSSSPASDPRRWQRIDVTSGHLRGEPVAVPENYAAQLGMRPGTLLSVTGPGNNAVVLVWRDRQPVFDSLQPVLMRLNAQPGDSVYVTVDGYRLDAQLTSLA